MIRALVYFLQNNADIKSIAPYRIYPVVLPEGQPTPSLTYQRIASIHLPSLDSTIGMTRTRIQIDAWGRTYGDADELRKVVIQALSGRTINYEGTHIQNILPLSDMDMFDHDAVLYQARTEFYIFH